MLPLLELQRYHPYTLGPTESHVSSYSGISHQNKSVSHLLPQPIIIVGGRAHFILDSNLRPAFYTCRSWWRDETCSEDNRPVACIAQQLKITASFPGHLPSTA